jgi:hypothetical protein
VERLATGTPFSLIPRLDHGEFVALWPMEVGSTKVEGRTAYSVDVFGAGAEGRCRNRAAGLFIGRSTRSSHTMLTRCLGEIGTGVE